MILIYRVLKQQKIRDPYRRIEERIRGAKILNSCQVFCSKDGNNVLKAVVRQKGNDCITGKETTYISYSSSSQDRPFRFQPLSVLPVRSLRLIWVSEDVGIQAHQIGQPDQVDRDWFRSPKYPPIGVSCVVETREPLLGSFHCC